MESERLWTRTYNIWNQRGCRHAHTMYRTREGADTYTQHTQPERLQTRTHNIRNQRGCRQAHTYMESERLRTCTHNIWNQTGCGHAHTIYGTIEAAHTHTQYMESERQRTRTHNIYNQRGCRQAHTYMESERLWTSTHNIWIHRSCGHAHTIHEPRGEEASEVHLWPFWVHAHARLKIYYWIAQRRCPFLSWDVLILFHPSVEYWILLFWFSDKLKFFSRTEQLVCWWTTAEHRSRVAAAWNRFKHPPLGSNLLLSVPRRCFCCGLSQL